MKGDKITGEIYRYKRKFYTNQLIKGLLITLGFGLGVYILFTSIEYFGRMSSIARGTMFFGYLLFMLSLSYRYILLPLLLLFHLKNGLSDEDAARKIGSHFPAISDRLLNYLQLKSLAQSNMLAQASLEQRSERLSSVSFAQAIDYTENKSHLRILLPSLIVAIAIAVFVPQLFTAGTQRIISYSEEFAPVAPFSFSIDENQLIAFKNEDHLVQLTLSGPGIPEAAYILHKDRRIKMASIGNGVFEYVVPKIQSAKIFQFEAAGYLSMKYTINIVERPNLSNFNVFLEYPAYLGKTDERVENTGNLIVPQGTNVKWQFSTSAATAVEMIFPDAIFPLNMQSNNIYEFDYEAVGSLDYSIKLSNEYATNKDQIVYKLNVVPDEYPAINLQSYQDTILYSYLVLGGNVSDDYGLSALRLIYTISDKSGKEKETKSQRIPLQRGQSSQSYFYQWTLDSVLFSQGDEIKYYTQVWDNDGYNGVKSSKSAVYTFSVPTEEDIESDIEKASQKTTSELDEALKEAEELNKNLKDLEEKLKGKKQLEWQDEKRIEEILKQREALEKSIEELQKQFDMEKQKKDRFQEQSEEIQQKVADIEELMKELLDEETRKLYEELQKLLEEEQNNDKIQDMLEQIDKKEDNLVKELERTLELFKRMKFDYKLEENISKLDEMTKEQESLSEESLDESNALDSLSKEQEDLKEEFEEFEESMEELNELNQELKNPNPMDDQKEEQEDIKEQMEQSKEELDQNQRKNASDKQKKSAQQMKQMSQQMQQMQASMEMQQMQANLDDLRDILHNLITLSFDQEALMKDFRTVDQSDPRFVDLGQWELNIRDDAKIVEDSLLSLAERAGQLGSFVTREVSEMNGHLENSIQAIRDRKKTNATSEQQYTMTSMNNLALMLDDVLAMMQQNLSEAMGKPSKGKPQNSLSMSELQKQLNKQIEDLKRSGKEGRNLSEELAKLAAEQERIRKAMQEMENSLNEGEGDSRNSIAEKMEETEVDLVNKRITAETIERQKEILTRLLEAENAMREKELDNEREGETAKEYQNELPIAFDEYFKAKEKEIELLKTVPPKLYPYYKKEVNEYFKRIGNQKFE
jgi:hypothetical protein